MHLLANCMRWSASFTGVMALHVVVVVVVAAAAAAAVVTVVFSVAVVAVVARHGQRGKMVVNLIAAVTSFAQ